MKGKHLLIIKENLPLEVKYEIAKSIKKHRKDFVIVFGENIEYHKLD